MTIIRLAEPDDLPDVLACLDALTPGTSGLPLKSAVAVYRGFLADGARLYVAELPADGPAPARIVGTATLRFDRTFCHGGGVAARIENVAVRTDHQRRGVGGMLVTTLAEDAFRRGSYKVILQCTPALARWYKRLGFRAAGHNLRLNFENIKETTQ